MFGFFKGKIAFRQIIISDTVKFVEQILNFSCLSVHFWSVFKDYLEGSKWRYEQEFSEEKVVKLWSKCVSFKKLVQSATLVFRYVHIFECSTPFLAN